MLSTTAVLNSINRARIYVSKEINVTTSNDQPVLAFIGAGNMSSAIIGGLLAKRYPAHKIWATDPSAEKRATLQQRWGIHTCEDNSEAAAQAEVLVLAVKPQSLKAVAKALRPSVQTHRPLVVSIAAGIMSGSLEQWLGEETAIVRCMPNTPALVETGACGLYANARTSDVQKQQAEQVLKAVGLALWVEQEALLDAVTAVSGSGPAYYFMFMEAMISAGESLGLSREDATRLTLQTALGAAKMALGADEEPAVLRRRVTSPYGTTEQAILAFERGGLQGLVAQAMGACADRSRELGEELGQ
jgi:pyrroline-5-carboxylate reductase